MQAGLIVGRTQAEAEQKWELYQRHTSLDGVLAHAGFVIDPTAYPPETLVADVLAQEGKTKTPLADRISSETTVGDLHDEVKSSRESRYFAVGTPEIVADQFEQWMDDDGIDGINLRQYHSFGTARDFGELLAPELRRRGRLREMYHPGETLRERVFGAGNQRLPDTHPAARYRQSTVAVAR